MDRLIPIVLEQNIKNMESSGIKVIDLETAYQFYNEGNDFLFINVRTQEEYKEGRIKGTANILLSEMGGRRAEIPKKKR
ncbi:MAG: rhodanese-like domain-containing protein [Candidatus Humimicrobiaceae bacterium]